MPDLPLCARCSCAFERHTGWWGCHCDRCSGYASELPLEPKVGDELAIAGAFRAGVSDPSVPCVVIELAGSRARVRLEDGQEQEIDVALLRRR